MKIAGDYASFYNCRFHGFQDTLCDDRGKHFFKDCYVEGTVDFIFGSGQSLYVNSEIHVIPGDPMALITAHSRSKHNEANGYVFCTLQGDGRRRNSVPIQVLVPLRPGHLCLLSMSEAVHPQGWSNNAQAHTNSTVYFGEYHMRGQDQILPRGPHLLSSDAEVKPFLSLAYIEAGKWLLPPATPRLK
ncbi:Pectinesterase 2 [Sesamum angolense]|uniref:Pectinesterase n=1 Tax=Sesamum angolense TaxID=2727404 RepID=A0AAE2BGX6_9LAMI|nr:Pectinesterase 2 [Sesamum angolense]